MCELVLLTDCVWVFLSFCGFLSPLHKAHQNFSFQAKLVVGTSRLIFSGE